MNLWEGFEKTVAVGADIDVDLYVADGALYYAVYQIVDDRVVTLDEGVLYDDEEE